MSTRTAGLQLHVPPGNLDLRRAGRVLDPRGESTLEWLGNRKRLDGEAVVERGHTKDWLTETLAEVWHSDHRTGTQGTTPHDNADEVSLIDTRRKQRKGFKERRKRMGERKASH